MKYLVSIVAVSAIFTGCGKMGQTAQGRVIAYDRETRRVTLIRDSETKPGPGALPPITIEAPTDPSEMGPAPAAGGLLQLDAKNHRVVIYDRAAQAMRTIDYTPVAERHNIAKKPAGLAVDRAHNTITVYSRKEHLLVTFRATADLLLLPADTWQAGDVVRYYYKDPAQALRLMNVSQTDLSKASG